MMIIKETYFDEIKNYSYAELLKSHTDGKSYMTDVADTEQLLRIIQSIPSPKA